MRALVAAGLVLLLTGCSGQGDADATNASTGVLRGVVVDEAVRPLAGVAVTAAGPTGTLNATTGRDGLFTFLDLSPGLYVVEVRKAFYSSQQQAIDVHAGDELGVAKFQIAFQAAAVPYANLYKLDGLYECGLYVVNLCSNVNIATWIVVCANTGVCLGNVTTDRSVLLQYIEPGVTFLQAELTWQPSVATATAMGLTIGGANEAERRSGFGAAYNSTNGEAPLRVRLSNHEGPDAWCKTHVDPPCADRALDDAAIGTERVLVAQVSVGAFVDVGGSCGVDPAFFEPCGAGLAVEQPFTMFTTAFYGYEPPADWFFATAGALPAPT